MSEIATVQHAKKIRVGLVGVGNWAKYGHMRVLKLLPEYEIVAIYSQRKAAADAAAQERAIPHVAGSLQELVTNPDVDMVIVLTTAPQHEDGVRAAIAAGKDVYCEWPFMTSTAKAEELLALAKAAGVRHVVGLQRRLAPFTLFVRDQLQRGYVGKLRSARIHVSMNYFQALRPNALRWTIPPENLSSVVDIYAGHFLDMLFAMVGDPTEMAALTVNQFKDVKIAETGEVFQTTTPDQLIVAGRLAGDAVLSVHIESGKRNGSGVRIDITGDEGDMRITNRSAFGDVGDDYVIEGARGDNLPLMPLKIPSSFDSVPKSGLPSAVLELASLYATFARDRAEGGLLVPSFEDAVWTHKMLDGFVKSSKEGIKVAVAPRRKGDA
jgi:predicted dehydrogenase